MAVDGKHLKKTEISDESFKGSPAGPIRSIIALGSSKKEIGKIILAGTV
jgi:hypothetical protein